MNEKNLIKDESRVIDSQAAFIKALSDELVIKSKWDNTYFLKDGNLLTNDALTDVFSFAINEIKQGIFSAYRIAHWTELVSPTRPYLCHVAHHDRPLIEMDIKHIYDFDSEKPFPYLATDETVWKIAIPLTDAELDALKQGL